MGIGRWCFSSTHTSFARKCKNIETELQNTMKSLTFMFNIRTVVCHIQLTECILGIKYVCLKLTLELFKMDRTAV